MKINASKFYTALFLIVIFSQLYLNSFKANIFLQLLVLGVYFYIEKPLIKVSFLKIITPLIVLFFLAFVGTLLFNYQLYNIIKDIFHLIKPLLGILIGYFLYRKINDFNFFIKTIVLAGLASAILHFIIVFLFSNSETVSGIREFGKDNFLELFALFFLAYYKKFQKENLFKKRLTFQLIFFTLLASCALYLSRTMIIVSVIVLLSFYGFTIINSASIKLIAIFVLLVIGFFMFLNSINIQRDKKGIEAFLYKVKIAPSEILKTNIDRENHKDLWDHWRGYEAKRAYSLMKQTPGSFIYGCGMGSLVNLKFYAPLTGEKKGMRYISELHNGYAYVFYKMGIIGLIIYLMFLFSLYRKIYKNKNFVTIFISTIGLVYIFTTLTITGLYNSRDIIVFILGGLLYFESQSKIEEEYS